MSTYNVNFMGRVFCVCSSEADAKHITMLLNQPSSILTMEDSCCKPLFTTALSWFEILTKDRDYWKAQAMNGSLREI